MLPLNWLLCVCRLYVTEIYNLLAFAAVEGEGREVQMRVQGKTN